MWQWVSGAFEEMFWWHMERSSVSCEGLVYVSCSGPSVRIASGAVQGGGLCEQLLCVVCVYRECLLCVVCEMRVCVPC